MTTDGPPPAATGKNPPPVNTANAIQPLSHSNESPIAPIAPLSSNMATGPSPQDLQSREDIMKTLIEHTEHSNALIKRHNALRWQRRLNNPSEVVLDDDIEEPVPNISSFLSTAQKNSSHNGLSTHTPMLASGSRHNPAPGTEEEMTCVDDSGQKPTSAIDWHAFATSMDLPGGLKQQKNDYTDYLDIGVTFKTAKASKNTHELDPTAIPNTLRQMAGS